MIFLIPSGWLTDWFCSKRSMMRAVVVWSCFTVMLGMVRFIGIVVPRLLSLRFLLGAAVAPVCPASGRIIAAWFPSAERGVAGAIFNSAPYLSLALFTPVMGWLCYTYGWEYVFIIMGAIGLVIGAIWWKLYYLPVDHPKMNAEELRETTPDPENRTLVQVSMRDAAAADEMFRVLMGDKVEPRREFIEKHALEVRNLDV